MAVTAAEQASIIELAILMFDVAPGAAYLPFLTTTYEQNGRSLSALADVLDGVGPFLQLHPANEPANTFADEFLGPLGLAADAGARAFVLDALNGGMSKGQIAYLAWNFLHNLAPSMPQQYQDAKAIMENKGVVAAHYSNVLIGAAEDLATLHEVIADVTPDDASVAAAIDALDDELASGPVLTIGHDFVNPGGTAPLNVTGTVDGDDDGGTASGTYSDNDSIIGNGNTNLKLTVRETGDVADAAVANIESIYLISDVSPAGGEVAFDAADWTDIGAIRLAGGREGLGVVIDNLEAGTGVSIEGVSGSFEVGYAFGAGIAVELANPDTNETSSFTLEADGDAQVVLGAGASAAIDAIAALGDVSVQGSDGVSFDVAFEEGSASAGDFTLTLGDDAMVGLLVSEVDEATLGAVSLQAGAAAEVEVSLQDVAGDAQAGAIEITAGDGSTLSVDADEIEGELTLGAVTIEAGLDSALAVQLTRAAGGLTVGAIAAIAGAGSTVAAVLSGTDEAAGDLSAGDISLAGSVDASLLIEDFNDAAVGDVAVAVGDEVATDVVIRDIAGNLTAGDVQLDGGLDAVLDVVLSQVGGSVTAGDIGVSAEGEADVEVRVSSVEGAATLGAVSLEAGDEATARVSVGAAGDVVTGALTVAVGDDADVTVTVDAEPGSDLTTGVVSVTAGESALVNVNTSLAGTLADSVLGAFTSGGVSMEVAQDAMVTVRMGQSLVTTNTEDPAAIGNLAVGDLVLVAGDNAEIDVVVEQTAVVGDAESYTDGDFLLGDVSVSVSATTTDDLSGSSGVGVSIVKSANPGAGTGGNFTVGDVALSGGELARLDADIAYEGAFAAMGDVSIGVVSLQAGDDALSAGARVSVSNAVAGGLGDFALGGASIAIGSDGEATLDIELSKVGAGHIGNVAIGALTLEAGEDSEIGVDFDVFGVTGDTVMGNFSIGDVSVELGEGALADLGGLGIPAADLQAIGTVGIGAVSGTLADDAELVFRPGIVVDAAMGAVTAGAVGLTLGEGADLDYDVTLAAATVGALTAAGWTVAAGEASQADLVLDVQGNTGAVAVGAIALDLTQYANVAATVSVGGADSVGGATFGGVSVAVEDGAQAALAIAVSAADAAGDMTVGDVTLAVADLELTTGGDDELEVGGLIQVSIDHAGDEDDSLTIGNVSFDVAGTADGDEIALGVSSNGDVVIGDISVSGKGIFILDGDAHTDPTLDLNVSYLRVSAGGEITIGNVDFTGYENDIVLDFSWIDHGAASITGGEGNDTVAGTTGNNTLAGGDGVDTIDLADGGVDTVRTANGDSGKTEATLDSVLSFVGGTSGAGDKLDFDLVAGSSGNYVEGNGAATFAEFISEANAALNSTVRYFAEVMGSDILVAVNFGSGEADMVIKLVGTTNLANLSYQNFVA